MKYILISILAISTVAQAKPFSLADYAAQTGKLPTKSAPKPQGFAEKVITTSASLERLEAKKTGLVERKQEVSRQYSERMAKVSKLPGDKSRSTKAAYADRKSRLLTIDLEIEKLNRRIVGLNKMLAYYKHMVIGEKMANGLRAEKLISFVG